MSLLRKVGMQFKKPTGIAGQAIISDMMIIGNRPAYDTLIKDLKIQPGNRILEIGYGPGVGIDIITKECETCDIYGIDFSELMYRRALRRNKHVIEKNRVHLLLGDFLETEIGYDQV